MKYDPQLSEVQKIFPTAQNILIALPKEAGVDALAAGLSLYLSLEQNGKQAVIVTEGIIRVGHTNLFGVGQIQSSIPQTSSGDYVITLGGIVDSATKKPTALKDLDWYPEGTDLNLVFHVLPGHRFEPTFVTPRYQNSGFDLIFAIGVSRLDQLGVIYSGHQDIFSNAHIVNIDNTQNNNQFGVANIVDQTASSLSEMVADVIRCLNLPYDSDIATNTLSGIFSATNNLQSSNIGADTYEVVAAALRAGGNKPSTQNTSAPGLNISGFTSPVAEVSHDSFTVPQVVDSAVQKQSAPVRSGPAEMGQSIPQSSPEEVPHGEDAISGEIEADWLTPKIFKGSSAG